MSILRNAFDQNIVDQEQANFLQEQADAQGMGAIRRSWNGGRVGGDLNAARIDEAAALAAGDAQKAALLGQQREHLEQRQAMYAPEVGRVEDIRGLGDALSWAGTQVGQNAASTVEPAALGAAGTALGKLPGLFKLAPLAAGIGALALNQRQMAGEHVGRLREDPTAMANLGAKGVYDQANLVGAAGGALETLFPFAVGRAFGGAALRQGAGGLMGRSFGAKTLGGMAMGGGTEVAQGEIGRFAHTDANALRKTEGDWSDRLNELAGGLAGDAPFSAAGAAADMAYGGTARAGEVVKEKAGEVVDMAADAAGKVKQAYKDSGLKGAVDLGVEGTKSVFKKTKEYVGDQVNHDAAVMRAVADVERYTMTPQEFALLTEAPPPDLPPDQQRAWTDEMFGKRQAHLFEKMLSLEEQGVPEATQFVDRMTSDDPLEATKAVYDATDFLFERHAAAAAQQRSAVLKAMSGGFIQQAAKKMTRGAKVVGDAAAFAGLNAAEGVRQGLGKKNKQGVAEEGDHSSPRQLDYETWKRMREAGGVGAGQGELFGRPSAARVEFTADEQKHAIARANKLFERGDEKPIKTDPVAAARSLERATLFAEIMAAEARARKQRVVAHRVEQDGDAIGIENFARYVAYEIADMAESWSGRAGQTAHPTAKDKGQAKVAISLLDSMADDIVGLVGSAAGRDVVSRMAQQGAPESQPFFELLQERVTNWRGNAAERAARERTARDQMVALLPQQFQADLLANDGIGARKMYETIGAIARGLITPQKREEIEQYIPRETLNQMLTLYGATVPDRGGSAESGWLAGDDSEAFDPDRLSMNDDGDVVEGASDFEKNMGEKALSRGGVGQKRYGHPKSPTMRENPFAPAKRMTKEEYIAFRELERERRMAGEPADVYPEVERPQLFTKGQKYSDGRDAIEARIEAMSEKLGPDFSVTARSAQDVMDAGNMHAASRLAIFRDYMFAASRDTSLPLEAQLTAKNRAHLARKALLDALDDPGTLEGLRRNKVGDANMTEEQKSASGFGTPGVVEQWVEELLKDYEKAGGVRQNKKVEDTPPPRLTPGERKILYAGMENYFRSRYIVEAERQIDRESSKIDAVEIRKMIEKGRGTYDVLKRDYGDGTDEMKAAMADSNLLWFKSTLHDERTGKPDEVPISANTLVGWVRKQRSLSEEYSGNDERLSNRDKNDAFLSDLYEGISILMNSGFMTDDLPYLKGPDGKPQTFEDVTITAKNKKLGVVTGRIPANLQLETTTGSGYMFARDERARKVPKKRHERTKEEDSDDARDDERYQKARDWELARGDDLDDGGGNEATQIEVGEGERETLNPYEDIKRKALKASSAAYEKRLGVEQQMRELGLALQKAQEKGSAVQIAALARRVNELAVVADGLPTEPPDTIEEIESRLEATRAELIAAMAAGGGDAKRIAKLGEEAAAKKRWVAPLELRGQATAASVMKQRVASLEDQRREERAPGEKISTLKRRLFELTALLDTELNKEHEKSPPGTPGAPKRARVKSLAKETLDAGDRDGIDAAYAQGKRAAAMREEERQSAAPRTETPEERMAREAGLLGWLDDTGARENETPAQRRARLQKARKSALLGEASEQGGKRAHSAELERQDTQRAAGLRNNRIDRWRVDRDVEEHVLAAAKRAADDEGLKFDSAEYREFMRNYTERRLTDRSRDSEQVTAEKVDLSMRSKMVGAGIGPEPKHSARKLAEDRAGAILETFRRHGVVKGMEVLESRLRTAEATNTDGGAGTVGGAHYAWPLAHILNKRQIEGMDLAATDPQDLKILRRLLAMRSELAKVIHDSTSLRLADKVDMVKAMASAEGAERVNATNVMKMLAGAAQPARDAEAVAQEAAREQAAKIAAKKAARGVAAAEAPKSQPKPGGAAKAGFKLTQTTTHAQKDQKKANRATKFIGRGSERSSTNSYANDAAKAGVPVNAGTYAASDVVFVSAEGNRTGRVAPDLKEIDKAVQAGTTILTDNAENRQRAYNVGEREVEQHLLRSGYVERSPGEWGPRRAGLVLPSRLLNKQEMRALLGSSPSAPPLLQAAAKVEPLLKSLHALGVPHGSVFEHKLVARYLQPIREALLAGDPVARAVRDLLVNSADQAFALPFDPALEKTLQGDLESTRPSTLGNMLAEFEASALPDHVKVIARAVRKVAGSVPVGLTDREKEGVEAYDGFFDSMTGRISIRGGSKGTASTILHEGAHAATVRALSRDMRLRQAVSDLMDHVVKHDPSLLSAYGMTNSLEFVAEALSNGGLQRKLYKIPASPKVAKYLGETVANAWEAFVGLVRKAMNLPPEHTSALTQVLELSGRAMKSVGKDGDVRYLEYAAKHVSLGTDIQADQETMREAYREVLNSPAWAESVSRGERNEVLKGMTMPQGSTSGMSHFGGFVLAEIRGVMRATPPGVMTAKRLENTVREEVTRILSAVGGTGAIPLRKLSLQGTATGQAPVRQLNKRLVGLLAERGIKVEESALEHVPPEMRVSLVNRTLMADLKEPLAEDVAKFISWMTVDSDMYQKIADGIAGTAFEKAILSEVNRDARQSMYTPARKQREVVRRAVERLLTNGLMKKHAAEAPLPLRVVQMVRSAIKGIMEALGGVKYKDLQGLADQYVDDLLNGKITLERPRKPGTVRVDPYEAFKADQHAADLTFALTDGGGFALTGSLAYASQGSVYRPAGATIHDLDFTTSLTQRAAEQRLERLYPQAHKVRSFGGLGDFVSTYVVPPKGHRVDLAVVENGVVRAFVVRDASGKIVGRYTNNDKGEASTGVKGTVVDLISDKRGAAGKLTAPTTFGDKQIPIADAAHAMAQKLMYARDKDIIDFANFVPNSRGRKLNAQGTADPRREALIDEFMNSPGGEAMGFDPTDRGAREEVRGMFDRGELSSTAQGKAWAKLGEVPSDEQLLSDLPEAPADTQGDVGVDEDAGLLLDSEPETPTEAQNSPEEPPKPAGDTQGATEAKKRATAGVATDEEIKLARAYFEKVLGKQIKAEFHAITGYSGEWIEADNLIFVSTLTGAGTMNVARHEALHAFWSKFVKNNPKVLRVLTSLTDDPRILQRLQVLLKDEPAALAQLTDGEERLAYIYQFAMAGLLKLPHRPGATLMHKVRKFLRRAFQMISDQERAVDLLYAFEHGKLREPSAAGRVIAKTLAQGTALKRGIRAIDGLAQWTAAQVLPANTILSESPSATVRAMAAMFYTNPGEEGAADGGQGYLNARNEKMRSFSNLFRAAIDGLDKPQLDALTEAMQLETPTRDIAGPDVADAKEELNALFARFHKYLTQEKGLRIGEIKKDYFPVVYNPEAVRSKGLDKLLLGKYRANIDAMVEAINAKIIASNNRLLEDEDEDEDLGETRATVTAESVVEAIVNHITRDNPTDDAEMEPKRQDGVLRPWFAGGERRVLSFLSPEDRAPFQEKDIVTTLSRYVRQGVRAAEYSSRFGRQGKLLARMLSKAEAELVEASHQMLEEGELKNEKARKKWAERQYRDVARAVGAMEGSLGHDVGEFVRKANSAAVVYQNIRLLPLALFSSFVDPLGIIARGGEMRLAYEAFTRGLRGVVRQWGDMLHDEPAGRGKDKWEKLAELAGVIDSATFSHLLTDEYGSVYMDSRATKINEIMFKANGMEAWNRGMRVGATKAAVAFMERHNQGKDEHSARWMRDLGFEVGHLLVDENGNMLTDKREVVRAKPKWTMEEAEAYVAKTHAAINRWVESAIMSPNAAQRPAWGSDPHYGMFWHLKQFAYSFHTTMIKRAVSEASYGNYSPLGVFAWYIPTMIASDIVKNLALGAGELPAYMKSYDLGDWVLHGANRSGALGVGHLAIEGVQDPASLAGPTVEQVKDIYVQPAKESIIEALPANALYGRWLK